MNSKNIKVAFSSGKGGTGKTSIATHFAKYLSITEKTAFVDLDVEEPNGAIFFKNRELRKKETVSRDIPTIDIQRCSFCKLCVQKCNFNAIAMYKQSFKFFYELCKSCNRCQNICPNGAIYQLKEEVGEIREYQSDNLFIKDAILKEGSVQTKHLIQATKKISDNFTWTILDSPPGTTCPMVETVSEADFVVLVAEPTPFGFNDLKLAIEVVKKTVKNWAIVINKSGAYDSIIEDFASKNGYNIIEKFPFDRVFAEKYAQGEFFYTQYSEKMERIKKHILEAL
ncbi:ATP-binding protein [bacterium]|nr:ATP-binding protein [bacterium]